MDTIRARIATAVAASLGLMAPGAAAQQPTEPFIPFVNLTTATAQQVFVTVSAPIRVTVTACTVSTSSPDAVSVALTVRGQAAFNLFVLTGMGGCSTANLRLRPGDHILACLIPAAGGICPEPGHQLPGVPGAPTSSVRYAVQVDRR